MTGRKTVRTSALAIAVVGLALAGCAAQLVPAPGAALVPGRGHGAAGEAAGVRVIARTEAWRGFPMDLDRRVTPVLLTIENGSGRPLRLRYEQLALAAPGGPGLAARDPYEIDGYVSEPIAAFPRPAPFYGPRFGFHPFYSPFFWDPWWYEPWPVYRTVALPTGDMVGQALREQTLDAGARVTGFVYFDRVDDDVKAYDFTLRLVDARSGEAFGTVAIPFVVE
jgi:hypothetical protein